MNTKLIRYSLVVSAALIPNLQLFGADTNQKRPNILWITSEDNSPFLGCYGDSFATTPNLDQLAAEGFMYTHAYANAPVSAAVRNTLITGVYACSGGNQQMRSQYLRSDVIHHYPEYFRKAGYYCTNNPKEDYNINPSQIKNIWDESSRKAHYKNRKPGQPFFAIFNLGRSHESSIHRSIPTEQLKHSPNDVKLPPYHPDTPEMRHDWAQYYDVMEKMDAEVGAIIQELKDRGEYENTIIFYYGDHGGVLARSKRYVYETGTRIPFIIRIPEQFKKLYPAKPGSKIDRLVSAVDFIPTLLSILGTDIPDWMQGKAFLGEQATQDPEYVYMFRNRMDERFDMTRAVRDKQFRYIRNYMPHRIYGQHINYLWQAPSIVSWQKAYLENKCNAIQSAFWEIKPSEELYDTENDPWEVKNLAKDPAYAQVLKRMRKACNDWTAEIKDADFIPEGEYTEINKNMPLYDYMRSGKVDFKKIQEMANLASDRNKANIPTFIKNLKNKDRFIRYWAAMGLLILDQEASPAIPALKEALKDNSSSVAVTAAESLYKLGEKELGTDRLVKALDDPDMAVRNLALNALDVLNETSPKVKAGVLNLGEHPKSNHKELNYDLRMVKWLKEKYNW